MRLSTKGRYSTRMMLELAQRYEEGPIFLKDISQSQKISLKYLSQLIIPLRAAGLVKSSRGAHGGYMLARAPEKISLREIVEAVEGPISIVECIKYPEVCNRKQECVTRNVWMDINGDILKRLNQVTLQELMERIDKKKNGR